MPPSLRKSLLFSAGTVFCFFSFCLLPLHALDALRSLDEFSYQTWQTGSGLPQNTVRSVLQSRDGFLWFATEGGLVRFDGYRFSVYNTENTPSLKSNHIRSLAEDRQGTMWIATAEGLCKRTKDGLEAIPSNASSKSGVLSLHSDHGGAVWAVTPQNLIRYASLQSSPGPSRGFTLEEGEPKLTGAFAVSSDDSTVWVGTETGLVVFHVAPNRKSAESIGLPQAAVTSLLVDRASRLWVGTDRGLFVSLSPGDHIFKSVSKFPSASVTALFEDGEGSIWAGTQSGLIRLKDVEGAISIAGRVLADTGIVSLAEDREGDLWVGTESQGVTIARNQTFVTYTTREGLADNSVRCVFGDRNGLLSIGTNAGLTQFVNGRFRQLTTHSGLSSNVILSLGEDRAGNLLIGTPDGLNRVEAGKTVVITSADGLADDFIRSLYSDTDGSEWVGTRRGLSHWEEPSRFTTYTQANGLGNDLVGDIVRDRQGKLWIATLDGLSQFEGARFRTYRKRDGLSSNVITALFDDSEGDLWIGTQDAGLNVWHAGKFSHLEDRLALPRSVYGITEDAKGNLWLASNTGIARAARRELKNIALGRKVPLDVVWYGTSDGLRVNECSAGGHPELWRSPDNTLWFSTAKGAAALYGGAAKLNRVPPPVVVESLTVDEQTLPLSQLQSISPGHSRFAFEYAALSFARPEKVRYRYMLEGFDTHWIDAGSQRVASYTNIPPGNYRFRVIARNGDGFWSATAAIVTFRLRPHFYQTLWFYALLLLCLGAAAYLIYRWRVAEVEARFDAVLQERNRIAREIHDTLAQGFVGISMQLEIVSRISSSSAELARQHLDQARQLVRDSLAEARRSIWQLRSQSSGNEDLPSRLSKAATQTVGISPIKVSLEVHGTYRGLGHDLENELLRIGQEAITNAVRHANPGCIGLDLTFEAKKVRLTVRDDGVGFVVGPQSSGPDGHFGLRGMQERAKHIGAKLDVESAAGKGTRVTVEAPLN